MAPLTFVTPADLEKWADRLEARAQLGRLVRLLIANTADPRRLEFASDEDIQLAGWDGVAEVDVGTPFVPEGVSGWEVSTRRDVSAKATEDYENREERPDGLVPADTTLVICSARRWPGKKQWAARKAAGSKWRGIRVLDGADLVSWAEQVPSVHLWLSVLVGTHAVGATSLITLWSDWLGATAPPIPGAVVLAGREKAAAQVLAWLEGAASKLTIRADSTNEAIAVVMATIDALPEPQRSRQMSRAVAVHEPAAWTQMVTSQQPLLLVPTFDVGDSTSRAVAAGHHVLLAHDPSEPWEPDIDIGPVSADAARVAFLASGVPEAKSRDLATQAHAGLMPLRRHIGTGGQSTPPWSKPSEAPALVPALLAQHWSECVDGDRDIIGKLAGAPYEAARVPIARWARDSDPPARLLGDGWFIVSAEDAWALIARSITRDDEARFRTVVTEVLGTPDPQFDMDVSERFMADAVGKAPRHSKLLAYGLARTLAMMGNSGNHLRVSATMTLGDSATISVRDVLRLANQDWRIWASLSRALPLLAEAAPDEFLSAIDAGSRGESPIFGSLFQDTSGTSFLSSSPHVGVLRALETLAWSPDFLTRAVTLLGRLAALDPGGVGANRPAASLCQILSARVPQTAASIRARQQALDSLRRVQPDVAWALGLRLLSRPTGLWLTSARPHYRDWVPDPYLPATDDEHDVFMRAVETGLIDEARQRPHRWPEFVAAIDRLRPESRKTVAEHLASVDLPALRAAERTAVWNALRDVVSKHRKFAGAWWALPPDAVQGLEDLQRRFEPDEPVAKYVWLFTQHPNLPEGASGDWNTNQVLLRDRRVEAAREVFKSQGVAGLIEFASQVDEPAQLGVVVGRAGVIGSGEDDLLAEMLADATEAKAAFGRGMIGGRVERDGRSAVEETLVTDARLTPAQRTEVLICMPCDDRTWNLAAASGAEDEDSYWKRIPWWRVEPNADIERAARALIEHGRPYSAIMVLGVGGQRGESPSAMLVVEALEAGLTDGAVESEPPPTFDHEVAVLLDRLVQLVDKAEGVGEEQIANIEFAYLGLLDRQGHAPRILHRALAEQPALFVDVLTLAHGAESGAPGAKTSTDAARQRAAGLLLDGWWIMPGSLGDGTIDAVKLGQWVDDVRALARKRQVVDPADRAIGRILCRCPVGADGAWPHEQVRAAIESTDSRELEGAFAMGRYNDRGAVARDMEGAAAEDTEVARRYARDAAEIAARSPLTAATLRRLAALYQSDAGHETVMAEVYQHAVE